MIICRYYLISHLESVHQNQTFPCDKCGLQARSKAMLQNHYREAHSNVSVFCSECDFVTNSAANLRYHQKVVHKVRFERLFYKHSFFLKT